MPTSRSGNDLAARERPRETKQNDRAANVLQQSYDAPVTGFTTPGQAPVLPIQTRPNVTTLSTGIQFDGQNFSIAGPTLGVSKSVLVSSSHATGQAGNFTSNIDVASVRGEVTATVGPKSVSVNLSTGVTALHSDVNYKSVTLSNDLATAEAYASGSLGLTGASLSVGAGASLLRDRIDSQFLIGKFNVDVYGEGGIGATVHADAQLCPKNAKLGAGLGLGPEVGIGLDISLK